MNIKLLFGLISFGFLFLAFLLGGFLIINSAAGVGGGAITASLTNVFSVGGVNGQLLQLVIGVVLLCFCITYVFRIFKEALAQEELHNHLQNKDLAKAAQTLVSHSTPQFVKRRIH